MKIRYSRNNGTLHIHAGRYHILLSREAGIIRNNQSPCDRWIWGR
nr:MAG TPA: hypothetical protein [Caudoviricetes sp.]